MHMVTIAFNYRIILQRNISNEWEIGCNRIKNMENKLNGFIITVTQVN